MRYFRFVFFLFFASCVPASAFAIGESGEALFHASKVFYAQESIGLLASWIGGLTPWGVVPLLTLLAMFLVWWFYGRDPKGKGEMILCDEEPEGLRPALLGTLLEQRVSYRAITATLLDLARRGFLSIRLSSLRKGMRSSVTFFRHACENDGLLAYEKFFLESFFASQEKVTPEDLRARSFWREVVPLRSAIMQELSRQGLLTQNPDVVRAWWLTLAAVLIFFGIIFSQISQGQEAVSIGLAFFLSGIIVALFGWQMPTLTERGTTMRERAAGLRWFLCSAKKQTAKFPHTSDPKQETFIRLLSAAMAFDVVRRWMQQFDSLSDHWPHYIEVDISGRELNIDGYVNVIHDLHDCLVKSAYALNRAESCRDKPSM